MIWNCIFSMPIEKVLPLNEYHVHIFKFHYLYHNLIYLYFCTLIHTFVSSFNSLDLILYIQRFGFFVI